MNNKSLGQKGEKLASNYLISNGYAILDKNYRTPIGEIDIIAENNGILCIIEVKTGTDESTKYFLPEQRIDAKKRNRLRKLAEIYVKHNNINQKKEIRIDAISVIFRENKEPIIEHFENI
ncbi:YraN family protein [Patescibacteria group bacterium]|nr:YraN family protein [Patescibacteria group bacterium]